MDTDSSTHCGVGIRGVAMAIDSVVWLGLTFLASFGVGFVTGDITTTADGVHAELTGTAGAVALGLWLALAIGYHTLFEWRFGKTFGKYLVGIRVTRPDGSAPSLWQSLVRNVLRLVDWLPVCYALGIVVLFLSDRYERPGDRMGGTVVVRT